MLVLLVSSLTACHQRTPTTAVSRALEVPPVVRTWPSPHEVDAPRKRGMLVLWPIPESDMVYDAKLLVLLGSDIDPAQPTRRLPESLVGIIPAHAFATCVAWCDFDGIGGRDDFVVATRRGAAGYSNVHVWLRSNEHFQSECLSDGSRYLPYVGDSDSDGQCELYLSTTDHVLDDTLTIQPTTYRVLEYNERGGFVEARRIASADLPLEKLSALAPDESLSLAQMDELFYGR